MRRFLSLQHRFGRLLGKREAERHGEVAVRINNSSSGTSGTSRQFWKEGDRRIFS
ncbi:hypothetical protein [Calothrix sp. UHCC 0171]|uniref:hypothetical protein n=1 Tax=Calothrix sp. UHCC 0171 TaxID=3110245 RepID=UPI002B1F8835|nr:hypothetical protein [Calothrix sp. UHCC 0171]MEA5572535.1 hypothetical protein [Calothrix sp. UHCC 0171]